MSRRLFGRFMRSHYTYGLPGRRSGEDAPDNITRLITDSGHVYIHVYLGLYEEATDIHSGVKVVEDDEISMRRSLAVGHRAGPEEDSIDQLSVVLARIKQIHYGLACA